MKKHSYLGVFKVSQLSHGKNVSKESTATDHCKSTGQKVLRCHTSDILVTEIVLVIVIVSFCLIILVII